MRIMILGGTGMVGTALLVGLRGAGHEVFAPTRLEFDALSEAPNPAGFDVVINAIVEKNAEHPTARHVNSIFPHLLARACRTAGCGLIHLSSDAVLAGAPLPRLETAARAPTDTYGEQKAAGEPTEALVLRTSIIGPERRGFSGLLCWRLSRPEPCLGFTNHLWNGLTSLELARAIGAILKSAVPTGIRHLHGETVSKADLLSMLDHAFQIGRPIDPVRAGAARDQTLATAYPEFLGGLGIRPLSEQIADLPAYCDDRGRWRIAP